MARWILDTGVFIRAQDADRLDALLSAATHATCVVPCEVHRELTNPTISSRNRDKSNRARRLWEQHAGITILEEFPLDSDAGRLFRELRKGSKTPEKQRALRGLPTMMT